MVFGAPYDIEVDEEKYKTGTTIDLGSGEDLPSSIARAPVAAFAFGTSATPIIGSGTSFIRRQKRLAAAAEIRKKTWQDAQSTPFHEGAIRYLTDVRGMTEAEVGQVLKDEENWQANTRSTRPHRIKQGGVIPIYNEDQLTDGEDEPALKFIDRGTRGGATRRRIEGVKARTNDRFEDSPYQAAIEDYTKFYREKAEEGTVRDENGRVLSRSPEAQEIETALNRSKTATDSIIYQNQMSSYSMESPIIRSQVEYVEALDIAKKLDLPLGEVIDSERKHLSEGLWEIMKTAIGQGQPIPGMEGEDYIERAQYMGELMGWQGLVGMFVGMASRPIDTLEHKPNLPVMIMTPLLLRVARGLASVEVAAMFKSVEKSNPKFKKAMDKLRSGGSKAKARLDTATAAVGRVAADLPGAERAAAGAERVAAGTNRLMGAAKQVLDINVGYERMPMKANKGTRAMLDRAKGKNTLREILDMAQPGELSPITLGTAAKRTIQSVAIGYALGMEFEAGALSFAKRAFQVVRKTDKGTVFFDHMRKNFSRSEGMKSTAQWARVKEAAEALRKIPEDDFVAFETELFTEQKNQAEWARLRETDPEVPYEAVVGEGNVVPAGKYGVDVSERPVGYETTRGLDEGTRIEPGKETAADVITDVADAPGGAPAAPITAASTVKVIKKELRRLGLPTTGKNKATLLKRLEKNKVEEKPAADPLADAEAQWAKGKPDEVVEPVKPVEEAAPVKEVAVEVAPEAAPPATPPKGGGVEATPYTFEVEPGVEIPYVSPESVPLVSSWYKDQARKALRKVTGKAPTKKQLEAIEKAESQSTVKDNVLRTLDKDIDGFPAALQKDFFMEEMLNREEGSTPAAQPMSPKKLETLKKLRNRFGENLGTLFDKDYTEAWKARPGNKNRRFNPTEEVLLSITDEGSIVSSSQLAKLTRGERFSSRGRGKQMDKSIIEEAQYPDKEAIDKAAEVLESGKQEMTDPNRDQVKIELRETERAFEAQERAKTNRQKLIDKDKKLSKEERIERVDRDKERLNAKEGKTYLHSMPKLKDIAEALEDGLTPSTKGIRSRKKLIEALAEDPQAVAILDKFTSIKAKVDKDATFVGKKKRRGKKWYTAKETMWAKKSRRRRLFRLATEIIRSNLPQKMKTRLLEQIQPNAKQSPFKQVTKLNKDGKPYQAFGSHLDGDYPYKNFIEEVEAAKKGEYAAESLMGARDRPTVLEAKADINKSLKSIADDYKAKKISADKAIDMILDSVKEMREDLGLWQGRGPTPKGGTRGETRTITPKNKKNDPFRVQYVQPSYYGGKVRHRLSSVERHKKNNSADFESGRSRIHSDSYKKAAEREIAKILEHMEITADKHIDALRKDSKSSASKITENVTRESRGEVQRTLSPKAREVIRDIIQGKEVEAGRISDLPPLEAYAVRDLVASRPKTPAQEMNASKPPTKTEVKQAKATPEENGGVFEVDAESGTPKKVKGEPVDYSFTDEGAPITDTATSSPKVVEYSFIDEPAPGQPKPIVVGRPTTKRAPDPFIRESTVSSPAMARRFVNALDAIGETLSGDRVGLTSGEINSFKAGIFEVLKSNESSLLMSETMRARVLDSYLEEARETRNSKGDKVFNKADIKALEKSIGIWLDEFASPFFAPEGPAPWLTKEPKKFAEMISVLHRTPGNLAVRLDKQRLVYFEDVRAKVTKELTKMEKEGIATGVAMEAGKQASNNIKGRAISKAFGRIIQRDLMRRGVTSEMSPAEAAGALAARELISKEGPSYGLPSILTVDGEVRQVTPIEIAEAGVANPQAFINAAESLIGRKLSKSEMSDLLGVRGKRHDKRSLESRTVNSESPVGQWLNNLISKEEGYKKLDEKPEKGAEFEVNVFEDLVNELPEKERELIEKEREKVAKENETLKVVEQQQISEAAYLKGVYIDRAWHDSMSFNAGLRKEIDAYQKTNFGKFFGQVKRGSTMLSAKTSAANNLSHFINLSLLTGENPAALASRFATTLEGLAVGSGWKGLPKETRDAYKAKYPGRIEHIQAALEMNLVKTTMVHAELSQVAKNRGYNLWGYGDLREWAYGFGDSLPKTAEFIRHRKTIQSKMKRHKAGEVGYMKTSMYTTVMLRKNEKGKWERLSKDDKMKELTHKELDKMISVAAKLESDILIPDYNVVPRALKQARGGVGGKGWKQTLSFGAGLASPFLSYPYLMLDGPNKPGWLTRTFLSRSYDGPFTSTNKGVLAGEIAAELGTATRVALVFGNMSMQYESPETDIGRKAVRWSGRVGPDAPAYVSRGKDGMLKVVPLGNLHSGSSPELVWGTVGSSLAYAGNLIRKTVSTGLLQKEYDKLGKLDKLKYEALMDIEEHGGILSWGFDRTVNIFAATGNHLYDVIRTVTTQQNEWSQDLTGNQVMMEVADKLGAPLVPGGIDVYNTSRTLAAVAGEATGLANPKGPLSSYRNLIRSEEMKRREEFSSWSAKDRMAFLVENAFAASVTIYAREIDVDLREAMIEGKMSPRTPKVLKGYYDAFQKSYENKLKEDIDGSTGDEKERLITFRDTVVTPAFQDVGTRYDSFLSNVKEWMLRQEVGRPGAEAFLKSAQSEKKIAEEQKRKLIRERAAGYRGRREK